jgi:predicted transcriptional regulator
MSSTSAISLELDADIRERVERLAAAKQKSPVGIIREALEDFVNRAEKREQFRRDTLASWEDYRATGLHVDQEEIEEWADRLKAGEDASPPICHV